MKFSDRSFKYIWVVDIVFELFFLNNLQKILVLVYLLNYWGLSVVDVVNMEMYFDDGLVCVVFYIVFLVIKELLDLLCEMYLFYFIL